MPIQSASDGWILETRHAAYAFGLNAAGALAHRYWGQRLPNVADYPPAPNPAGWASFNGPGQLTPEEYPAWGGMSFVDPCLKATFADGTRDLVLRFVRAETAEGPAPELRIELRDEVFALRVTLRYRLHEAEDILERSAQIENLGDAPVMLERAWSAQWHLPAGGGYWLTHLSGRWADEMRIRREPLTHGIKSIESRRIATSHHHNPWFAVDAGDADEDAGAVWFGALAWSGNWKLSAEVTDFGSTRVSLGVNDFDFAWRLEPGTTFATPPCFAGYTGEGFGGASRRMHDLIREVITPNGRAPRMVLYNSWEATLFDVDEASQAELAERAAQMGVELFVMDDGWFHGRNSDQSGLGDWRPDVVKFPNGLAPLIARVHALGMRFGLWIEPEMVNPDSDLYRAHPDWVIHFPSRKRTEARNQLILNLGRTDVQDHLIHTLDALLSAHEIAFVKWDMNRNVSEPGWPDAPGDPREVWVRYTLGVYRVWETLRARHPGVIWQSCSGGGGRADLGILRMADQIWVSDNTEATARLEIQDGFSLAFPANVMEAWVTDAGAKRLSLAFRFHVSMCGALGVGGNLLRWTDAERAEAAKWIALYKELRPIIQNGDLFRLRPAQKHAFSAIQYASKDKSEGVLFAFRTHLAEPSALPPLYLRGLDPGAQYEVEGESGARSGLAWMRAGISIDLRDFHSVVRRIRRVA